MREIIVALLPFFQDLVAIFWWICCSAHCAKALNHQDASSSSTRATILQPVGNGKRTVMIYYSVLCRIVRYNVALSQVVLRQSQLKGLKSKVETMQNNAIRINL